MRRGGGEGEGREAGGGGGGGGGAHVAGLGDTALPGEIAQLVPFGLVKRGKALVCEEHRGVRLE